MKVFHQEKLLGPFSAKKKFWAIFGQISIFGALFGQITCFLVYNSGSGIPTTTLNHKKLQIKKNCPNITQKLQILGNLLLKMQETRGKH